MHHIPLFIFNFPYGIDIFPKVRKLIQTNLVLLSPSSIHMALLFSRQNSSSRANNSLLETFSYLKDLSSSYEKTLETFEWKMEIILDSTYFRESSCFYLKDLLQFLIFLFKNLRFWENCCIYGIDSSYLRWVQLYSTNLMKSYFNQEKMNLNGAGGLCSSDSILRRIGQWSDIPPRSTRDLRSILVDMMD